MKKALLVTVLGFTFVPSIAFAAWWNPITWKIFNKKPVEIIATSSTPTIEELSRKIELLEKQISGKLETKSQSVVPVIQDTKEIAKKDSKLTEKELITKVKPAVVFIETPSGTGSGSVIDSRGYVLTNAHVVTFDNEKDGIADGAYNEVKVTLTGRKVYSAELIGFDEVKDLAIIKILGKSSFDSLLINYGSTIEQGDPVRVFGFPLGVAGDTGEASVIDGIVSRVRQDYIEITNEIKRGNSGGAMVNQKGELVGVPTQEYHGGKTLPGTGIKEAIDVARSRQTIQNLYDGMRLFRMKASTENEEAISDSLTRFKEDISENPRLQQAISSARDNNIFDYLNSQVALNQNGTTINNYLKRLKEGADMTYLALEFLKARTREFHEFFQENSELLEGLDRYQTKTINEIGTANTEAIGRYNSRINVWTSKKNELDKLTTNSQGVTVSYLLEQDAILQEAVQFLVKEKERVSGQITNEVLRLF